MTLPKASTKLTVDFNRFDAMSFPANTNELEDVPADAPGGHVLNEQQQQRPPPLVLNAPFLNDDAAAAASTATSRALINTNIAAAAAATITSTITSTATIPSPATVVGITTTTASSPCSKQDFAVENVMPGIYLSKNFIVWNEENLHAHGFTHIIVIDRHIQELYYPSPIFKICAQSNHNTVHDPYEDPAAYGDHYYTQPKLNFSKKFEAIDLNFGEKSYLTTVLPNCYKAVRFLNKALLAGGTILVIDCNGGEQKCITIIVAYLMYKHNISFSAAFARLKTYYKKADLDRFFVSQLYEYEPILQVQRAQSRGHSCSREMHAAIFKRKKDDNDEPIISSNNYANINIPSTITAAATKATQHDTNLFLGSFNPLAQFNTNTTELKLNNVEHTRIRMGGEQEELQLKSNEKQNHSIYNTTFHLSPNPYTSHQLHLNHQVNAASGNCNTSSFMSINNSNWDDNAMEQC